MSLSNTALVSLVQAKNYLRVDAAAGLHVDAEFLGVGDGEDKTFDLDHTPVEGSLILKVNDVLQVEDTDFTLAVATITFEIAPPLNEGITASYDYAAGDNTFESYDDNILEQLIEAGTKKAEDYCGRAFVQREIVETHIGDNKQVLRLYRQPVVSVASITVGGDALTAYTERLTIGRIYHLVVWPLDYEVVVTYTAGYAANRAATQVLIPDAVIAVLGAVALWYENRMGIKSQNISGVGSVDYGDPEGLPEASKDKLDSLRVNVL